MPRSKMSKSTVLAAERASKALEMRMSGATYASIGSALGITTGAAHKAVARAMSSMSEETQANAETFRQLEVARLDQMLMGLWDKARAGDLATVDRVLRIMERRSRLLGLDALPPAKAIIGAGEIRVIYEE